MPEHDRENNYTNIDALWAEAAFFALIPAFAAAMARGYGVLAH